MNFVKDNNVKRPLKIDEYKKIIETLQRNFIYQDSDGKDKKFKANHRIALVLQLEANLGLRVSDILELTLHKVDNAQLETIEKKTKKVQYRPINLQIYNAILKYAVENNISNKNTKLFDITIRSVQKQLKIVTDYLNIENVSTHSFRKLFATLQYQQNNNNIELVKELLNHSSIATTQRYIRVSQEAIDKASQEFYV